MLHFYRDSYYNFNISKTEDIHLVPLVGITIGIPIEMDVIKCSDAAVLTLTVL